MSVTPYDTTNPGATYNPPPLTVTTTQPPPSNNVGAGYTESAKSAAVWAAIISVVGSWAINKYGGNSGSTPNQYPAELPPEVKRVFDEIWKVYKAGGSPAEQEVRSAGVQFLGGMPTTAPNFKFTSPLLQGQEFAAGVKIPKIDTSKFPDSISGAIPTTPTPKPKIDTPNFDNSRVGGRAFGVFGKQQSMGDGGSDPMADESIANWMTRTGGSSIDANNILNAQTPPKTRQDFGPTASDPVTFQQVKDSWGKYTAKVPDWIKRGVPAALAFLTGDTGLAITVLTPYIRKLFLGGGGQPPPTPPPTPPPNTGKL